jgi:hypothetical protein
VPVTLVSPTGTLSPVWEALAPRGQGPFRLDLRSTRHNELEHVAHGLAHGAQIALVCRD